MNSVTFVRILSDTLFSQGLKNHYWGFRGHLSRLIHLKQAHNTTVAQHMWQDQWRFIRNTVQPVVGQNLERSRRAVDWLIQAQKATPDSGVSMGFFPADIHLPRWRPSYPETTGYIISSLLNFSQQQKDSEIREHALAMAHWEVEVQMLSGAVQGGPVCPIDKQSPAVFNTGMVLDGWTSVLEDHPDEIILKASNSAAHFLLKDQGEDGHFQTHGPFVTPNRIKTYNVLCGWGLYRLGTLVGNPAYKKAAIDVGEAALSQQQANGWFSNNCLNRPKAPLTHTIGYTLQGLLELGSLANHDSFIHAVQKGVDPLLAKIHPNGFLAGRFYSDWQPACFSSCLTGSAQIAIVCFRLFEILGEKKYQMAGDKLINFLKGVQCLDSEEPSLVGALAGSFPLFIGGYMTGGYPNWATKYFLDGLMLQERLGHKQQEKVQ